MVIKVISKQVDLQRLLLICLKAYRTQWQASVSSES